MQQPEGGSGEVLSVAAHLGCLWVRRTGPTPRHSLSAGSWRLAQSSVLVWVAVGEASAPTCALWMLLRQCDWETEQATLTLAGIGALDSWLEGLGLEAIVVSETTPR